MQSQMPANGDVAFVVTRRSWRVIGLLLMRILKMNGR